MSALTSVSTDASGALAFEEVEAGELEVVASRSGFMSTIESATRTRRE
jgi:hypothetical protein